MFTIRLDRLEIVKKMFVLKPDQTVSSPMFKERILRSL